MTKKKQNLRKLFPIWTAENYCDPSSEISVRPSDVETSARAKKAGAHSSRRATPSPSPASSAAGHRLSGVAASHHPARPLLHKALLDREVICEVLFSYFAASVPSSLSDGVGDARERLTRLPSDRESRFFFSSVSRIWSFTRILHNSGIAGTVLQHSSRTTKCFD